MEEKKDLTQELERIKAELEELKKKLGMAEEKSLRELPTEALSKVMEVSKEIVKTTAEIGEKALRVVRYSVEGAVEGAKKALKEDIREFITKHPHVRKIDYVEITDENLKPVQEVKEGDRILLAVWIGNTRLIDNWRIGDAEL